MKRTVQVLANQTEYLTEENTKVNEKLDKLQLEVAYVSNKEAQIDKEIFTIKHHLKIVQ